MSTDTLVHADIFFFVTTIAVALVAVATLVFSVYLVKMLEQGRRGVSEVEVQADEDSEDLKGILYDFRESGVYRFLFRRKRKR